MNQRHQDIPFEKKQDRWDMNMRLLQLSESDFWRLKDAANGVQVLGATGTGKSTATLKQLAKAYLSAGFGGLVMCAKIEMADEFLAYAKECGRENSIIHITEDDDFTFDFLDYEMTREGGGDPENILDLFIKVIEITQKSDLSGGDNAYFYEECKALLRSAIFLCVMAYQRSSLVDVYNVITSAPTSKEQVNSDSWQNTSECFQALMLCNQQEQDKQSQLGERYPVNHELEITARYFLKSYPDYGDRLRSSVTSIFTSAADPWLRGSLRKLFCRKRDELDPLTGKKGFFLDPDLCSKEGAILLFDYPVKSGLTGRLAQSLYRLVWQQHFERRNVNEDGGRPCFLFSDEAQLFLNEQDQNFAQTARSSRVLTVLATQNLSNYYHALGCGNTERGKHLTYSLLGNLGTTIFHANGEETNAYASKLIGSQYQYTASTTTGNSSGFSSNFSESGGGSMNDGNNASTSLSEQERRVIQEREFALLRTGGEVNNYKVDAVIYQTGRVWNATQSNYLFVEFDQRD